MTIMHLKFPDDLVAAVQQVFPSETLEQVVERLLRAEVARRQSPADDGGQSLVEAFRRIREQTEPISDDEIRRLRHEGRP